MGKKILVVDYEASNRELFRQILSMKDYDVVEAENGKQALLLVEQDVPDLILLDLFMSGGDGLSVIRGVREDLKLRFIPIVVVTAAANEDIHQRIQEAGCDALIRKPVDLFNLLELVDKFLA
ncbi:MAG: response regulator [Candidatus Latescibacterota bacterium]